MPWQYFGRRRASPPPPPASGFASLRRLQYAIAGRCQRLGEEGFEQMAAGFVGSN
jgi:hypothetical protein